MTLPRSRCSTVAVFLPPVVKHIIHRVLQHNILRNKKKIYQRIVILILNKMKTVQPYFTVKFTFPSDIQCNQGGFKLQASRPDSEEEF